MPPKSSQSDKKVNKCKPGTFTIAPKKFMRRTTGACSLPWHEYSIPAHSAQTLAVQHSTQPLRTMKHESLDSLYYIKFLTPWRLLVLNVIAYCGRKP